MIRPTVPHPAVSEPPAFAELVAGINLRRIWWLLAACLVLEVVVFAMQFKLTALQQPGLRTVLLADLISTIAVLALTSWIRRRPPALRIQQGFVIAVVCALLAIMDYYFFAMFRPSGATSLYVIGVMCAGMLFLLPPRIFCAILGTHHLVYGTLVLGSAAPPAQQVQALIEGTVGVVISILAAWLIYTARRSDFSHERTLAASNAALHERNTEMNDLMAIAAHDLRSPLQGVQHLVEIAAHNPSLAPAKRQLALDEVRRTCQNLITLVGRLLDAHRAETAPIGRCAVDADFMPVVVEAVRRAEPLAARRGVKCELHAPAAASAVAHHDAGALQQALDNLIANAVKFASNSGTIAIHVRALGDHWRIEVQDDGPGISAGDQRRLFQKFFRGSTPTTTAEPSSGLGLFIVRKEVEAMGGSVLYEPRQPQGSIFVITLKAAPRAGVAHTS